MCKFYVTWRKSILRIFNMPYRTHCDMLPIITNCKPIASQLLGRMAKCICSAISSQTYHLHLLIRNFN